MDLGWVYCLLLFKNRSRVTVAKILLTSRYRDVYARWTNARRSRSPLQNSRVKKNCRHDVLVAYQKSRVGYTTNYLNYNNGSLIYWQFGNFVDLLFSPVENLQAQFAIHTIKLYIILGTMTLIWTPIRASCVTYPLFCLVTIDDYFTVFKCYNWHWLTKDDVTSARWRRKQTPWHHRVLWREFLN